MKIYDSLIIGGGASGLTASISSGEMHDKTIVLEACDRCGRKILASGNGRCNIMNKNAPRYNGESWFAKAIFDYCPIEMQNSFWNKYGLYLHTEDNGLVYPCTFQSSTVLSILLAAAQLNGVEIRTGNRIQTLNKEDGYFCAHTENAEEYYAKRAIICCGGSVQHKLGGSDSGYHILTSFGHTIVTPFPALTPIITDRRSVSGLSGIRIRCSIRIITEDKIIHSEKGELLFTDYGISGICAMQCSRFIVPGKSICELDLTDNMFEDTETLYLELKRKQNIYRDYSPEFLMIGILTPKVAFAVCKQAGLPMRGEKAGMVSEKDLKAISKVMKAYRLNAVDRMSGDHAQVTAGGALCEEFYPENMESKLVPGLFAAGEVLNVDGDCGGFNLMFAFTSGLLAGYNMRKDS